MAKSGKEEIYFHGGLDTDSDAKYINQGDYVDALNITKVEQGSGGIVVNFKGNELVYYGSVDHGESASLCGWTYYAKNNSIILFLYKYTSSTLVVSKNVIVEYNPETDVSVTIIDSITLGFLNPSIYDYFIKADMIDDWLAWTDSVNPPRMINIDDTITNSPTINAAYLDLCKIPPTVTPSFLFGTDTTAYYNKLTDSYQFKYRYVYNDYRPSVYSEASDLAISSIKTRGVDDVYVTAGDNVLYVKFNSGSVSVGWIDIAVRDGNNGAWGRCIKIDKTNPENVYNLSFTLQTSTVSDDTFYYYKFTNNESRVGIGSDGTKQYDTIPDKSETLSFLGENNLALGGNTDGKDLIDLGVTLTGQYNIPAIFESWEITTVTFTSSTIYINYDIDALSVGTRRWLPGDYVYFKFQVTTTGIDNAVITKDQYVIITEVITTIDALGVYLATNTTPATVVGENADCVVEYSTSTNTLTFNVAVIANTSSTTTDIDSTLACNRQYDYNTAYGYRTDQEFKQGKTHKLGIIYQDKYGKKWPVITSTETSIAISSKGDLGANRFAHIKYELSSSPPTGATSYRWAYAYRPDTFVQTIVTDASYYEVDAVLNTQFVALDVSANSQMIFPNYTFEAGDTIKVLGKGNGYTGVGAYTNSEPSFIVTEVKTTINDGTNDLVGIWLIIKPSNKTGYRYADVSPITSCLFINAFIEVSKPTLSVVDDIFYEIGGGGTIVSGHHRDWHWYTYAGVEDIGYINSGDAWFRAVTQYRRYGVNRKDVTPYTIWIESSYPYNSATIRNAGIGDPNIEYPESRSKYDNTIVYSKKYFQDTQVNGLSTFDFDRKKEVSDIHGRIKGLEELGNSLVIICEEKVLSSFIGATEYIDTAGQTNVVASSSVLGYIRPHAEKYGTFLKESILNTGKYIYFYDLYNSAVLRKSANGIFPISGKVITQDGSFDYKMRGYFKSLSESLVEDMYSSLTSPIVKCYMGYDPFDENIYITFTDAADTNNNVSLIFNESSNRWVSKYSGYVSGVNLAGYLFTKTDMFTIWGDDAGLYKQNSSASDRLNLYGVAGQSYIQFVTHASPNIIKLFDGIGIHADSQWTVDTIEADANKNYVDGFYSKILDSEFEREEGVYVASMPRNMKTRSSTASNFDRLNGEILRAPVIKIKLTNDETVKTELFKVDVSSTESA